MKSRVLPWMLMTFAIVAPDASADNGLVNVASSHSVAETIDRLESLVKTKQLTVFARIDFSGDAEKAGLSMPPTQMLIFGNPKAGTPLMLSAPSVAIDLPLKALAWQDASGQVWLSYNAPEYLQSRHGLPDALLANIAGIKGLVEQAAR
ncbi:MAG TPA: DUF302 domain-containing protein [Burkholderiales bacterium]|nr:DUF302 domain-containing protein [Burkholderiales bacterium]